MKRFLGIGALALVTAALAAPPASAWTTIRISTGFSVCWEGAGNSWLWGLVHQSQAPPTPPAPPGAYPGFTIQMGKRPDGPPAPVGGPFHPANVPPDFFYYHPAPNFYFSQSPPQRVAVPPPPPGPRLPTGYAPYPY